VPSVVPAATARPTPVPTPSPTRSGATFGLDEVTGDRFSPSSLTLRSGDQVLVTNKDLAAHTFTISGLGVDSGNMGQGDTFRYRFRAPGRYTFVCTYHESFGMTGTLNVTS
jgi:plastocyanin